MSLSGILYYPGPGMLFLMNGTSNRFDFELNILLYFGNEELYCIFSFKSFFFYSSLK
jgi:hypothetical protein